MAEDTDTWIAVLRGAAKDGSVPDDEPSFFGIGFADAVPPLDAMAGRAGVPPLSGFYFDDSVFDDDSANEILVDRHGLGATQADMDADTFEMLPDLIRVYRSWQGPFFPPAAGLQSVRGIKQWAAQTPPRRTNSCRGCWKRTPGSTNWRRFWSTAKWSGGTSGSPRRGRLEPAVRAGPRFGDGGRAW